MAKKNKNDWIVFGAGNFIYDIVDAIESKGDALKAIVINQEIAPGIRRGFKGKIVYISDFIYDGEKAIFGFVSPNKKMFASELSKQDLTFANLIHDKAYVSPMASLGYGNFFGAGSVVGPKVKLGNYNYLNRCSSVGHDAIVGDMNHIGPGAVICGRSHIGNRCNIGAGAVINDGVKISDDITIGSLGVVTRDIKSKGTYAGVPVRILKKGS